MGRCHRAAALRVALLLAVASLAAALLRRGAPEPPAPAPAPVTSAPEAEIKAPGVRGQFGHHDERENVYTGSSGLSVVVILPVSACLVVGVLGARYVCTLRPGVHAHEGRAGALKADRSSPVTVFVQVDMPDGALMVATPEGSGSAGSGCPVWGTGTTENGGEDDYEGSRYSAALSVISSGFAADWPAAAVE